MDAGKCCECCKCWDAEVWGLEGRGRELLSMCISRHIQRATGQRALVEVAVVAVVAVVAKASSWWVVEQSRY